MSEMLKQECEIRRRILEEMIAEVAASIRQYERTLDGLRRRIEAEKKQHELLEQKRNTIGQHAEFYSSLSIADYIAKVLAEESGPMHVRDIVRALEENGVSTNSENGPSNSVLSSLSRRVDLFKRVSRGRYVLRGEVSRTPRDGHQDRELEEVSS